METQNKLRNPLTNRMVLVTKARCAQIAKALPKRSIPTQWLEWIKKYNISPPIDDTRPPAGYALWNGAPATLKVWTKSDRFSTYYFIQGNDADVQTWTSALIREYPPGGYGTHFQRVVDGIWTGSMSHSSD